VFSVSAGGRNDGQRRRLAAGVPFSYIEEHVYKKFLIKQEKTQKVFNNLIVNKVL
jgi:hypothetical protein